MFEIRQNEPDYAKLNDPVSQTRNCYGKLIETVSKNDKKRDQSLNINGDDGIGDNPNRYKQHGFYFNADNCIGCHACETACSEKNEVPTHLSFRSVGFVEGGTYPAYQRINISLACNHCDDPVCLKGCPTRAYTKFAEYGAVLQDPDICFGCGYCTWVCPYNAPQLDPEKGQVSKCNMCVDRLEVGLKPACVSACLGKALDFGVVENIPVGQQQAKTDIPGLPRTDITHPNIRFQQTRPTQREMTRSDAMPIKYHRDNKAGKFYARLDEKHGNVREWNWRKLLLSHETAHTLFTLCTQAAIGALILLSLGEWLGLAAFDSLIQPVTRLPVLAGMIVVIGFGLFRLNMHLGKPHRFYRGFNNLRYSPVSREIAGISGFFAGLLTTGFLTLLTAIWPNLVWLQTPGHGVVILTIISGLVGLYYMIRLYRIPARPYWNHWQTASTFIGSALSLGATLLVLLTLILGLQNYELLSLLIGVTAVGLVVELTGLLFHSRYLIKQGDEGAASCYLQATRFAYPWILRNSLLVINILAAIAISQTGLSDSLGIVVGCLFSFSVLTSAVIGRALFYAVVLPTTMPGAFFWKNAGFIEHARETGLTQMPQLGVVNDRQHAFDWRALFSRAVK